MTYQNFREVQTEMQISWIQTTQIYFSQNSPGTFLASKHQTESYNLNKIVQCFGATFGILHGKPRDTKLPNYASSHDLYLFFQIGCPETHRLHLSVNISTYGFFSSFSYFKIITFVSCNRNLINQTYRKKHVNMFTFDIHFQFDPKLMRGSLLSRFQAAVLQLKIQKHYLVLGFMHWKIDGLSLPKNAYEYDAFYYSNRFSLKITGRISSVKVWIVSFLLIKSI